MRMMILVALQILILATTVTAIFPREEALEERRIFKIGPTKHFWFSCDSYSMGRVLDCKGYYWAFAPKPDDLQINDIGAYRLDVEKRSYFNVPRRINYIVHRIVNITTDCITFKGDANLENDPFCIAPNKVRYVLLWEELEPWRLTIW